MSANSAQRLRSLLEGPDFLMMPCCYDAFSARLIERAGFPLTFMSGFAVSASRLGLPDTGLISYGEMVDQGRNINAAISIPMIGDGDTGYGNALNVKRTVKGYAQAGFAGIMIEDQVAPKRCGHTKGKQVVDRAEAELRLRAACDAKKEVQDAGSDIVIMARTDANGTDGFDEAMARMKIFSKCGADILFFEAPTSEAEMEKFCHGIEGVKMANMVEQGKTPVLPPARLAEIGYKIAAYPLTPLLAAMGAMEKAFEDLKAGRHPADLPSFEELKDAVGFNDYYAAEEHYVIKGK